MRLIDADALVNDLKYDIAIDEDILANVGTDQTTRSTTQFDKDCKQNAIDLVIGTPTIDAVSEWIPCEERLPKRQGYYICTCKDGSKYKRTTTVKWSNGWQLTGARAYWVVLAWMPLPKPYGEREGER